MVAGGHGGSKQKRTSMCPLLVGASCGCLGVPFFLAKHPRNVPMTAHLQAHDPDVLSGVWADQATVAHGCASPCLGAADSSEDCSRSSSSLCLLASEVAL